MSQTSFKCFTTHTTCHTYKIKALHLVSNLQWADTADAALSYSYLAMHFITRATPMYYIDGKDHDLKMKSSRNYLTNHTVYTEFKSHH